MTLMLDMNSIDIAFPQALSLIDCWLPMLHITQIPQIVEYMWIMHEDMSYGKSWPYSNDHRNRYCC